MLNLIVKLCELAAFATREQVCVRLTPTDVVGVSRDALPESLGGVRARTRRRSSLRRGGRRCVRRRGFGGVPGTAEHRRRGCSTEATPDAPTKALVNHRRETADEGGGLRLVLARRRRGHASAGGARWRRAASSSHVCRASESVGEQEGFRDVDRWIGRGREREQGVKSDYGGENIIKSFKCVTVTSS